MRYSAIEIYIDRDRVFFNSAVEITPYAHRYEDYDEAEFVEAYENGIRLYSVLRDHNEAYYGDTFLVPETHPLFNLYTLRSDWQSLMNMFPKRVTNVLYKEVIEELTRLKALNK